MRVTAPPLILHTFSRHCSQSQSKCLRERAETSASHRISLYHCSPGEACRNTLRAMCLIVHFRRGKAVWEGKRVVDVTTNVPTKKKDETAKAITVRNHGFYAPLSFWDCGNSCGHSFILSWSGWIIRLVLSNRSEWRESRDECFIVFMIHGINFEKVINSPTSTVKMRSIEK